MPEPENDSEFTFNGELEDFPEEWLELDRGGAPRLRRDRKPYVPEPLTVDATGGSAQLDGELGFFPANFVFARPASISPPVKPARSTS